MTKIVQELSDLGYIIVPRKYEKPARRGNEDKPPFYDTWIGKSHSARILAGG